MIRFIAGAKNSSKTNKLFDILKSIENREKILVIIPEQFTFEYEKMLYNTLGAVDYNKITVTSFKRLSISLAERYNSSVGMIDNDTIRLLVLSSVIRRLKKEKMLPYFENSADKSSFIDDCSSFIEELRHANLTAEEFKKISEGYNGSNKEKIKDLAIIYSKYEHELCERNICDSLTLTSIAAGLLAEHKTFEGYYVFFDEFVGFSSDELCVVKELIYQADCTVSLTSLENAPQNCSLFSACQKTQNQLVNAAKDANISVDFIYCDDFEMCKSSAIRALSKYLYIRSARDEKNDGSVVVCNPIDTYKEVEICAAQISHLILESGYRFRDIVVAARNIEDYSVICEAAFNRYDIPYFIDAKQNALQSALVIYVLNVLEAVSTRKYNTEKIMRYVKSTMSDLTDNEKTKLEEYLDSWSVDGELWLSDFTGVEHSLDDDEKPIKKLDEINKIRKKVIEPLAKLRESCANKTVAEMCKALFVFFDETKLSNQIYSNAINLNVSDDSEAIEIIRNTKKLWISLTSSIKSLYELCGDEKITVREFAKNIKLLLSQMTIASPPQQLDSVMLASIGHSRVGNPKVIFILGANDGVFPASVSNTSLLNDNDRKVISKCGIDIGRDTIDRIFEERLYAYTIVTAPTEKLYISYPSYDNKGKQMRHSSVVMQIIDILPNTEIVSGSSYSVVWYATNLKTAYYKYIENYMEKSPEVKGIEKILESDRYYKEKLKYISFAKESKRSNITPKTAKKLLIRGKENSIITSCTAVEKYYDCPFQYYMRYILHIKKPRKYSLDALNIGSLLHYCLEKLMTIQEGEKTVYNESFAVMKDDELKKNIDSIFDEYRIAFFGGDFGKTAVYDYMYEKLKLDTFFVVKNIRDELGNAVLKPHDFEKKLKGSDGGYLLKQIVNEISVYLTGSVDRIDVGEFDGKKLFRIVDYKSGKKTFKPVDLMYGLNLQMLLYLNAVLNDKGFEGCIDTAVLYQKIEPPYDFVVRGDKKTDESERKKQLKGFGVGNDEYLNKSIQGDVKMEELTKYQYDAIKLHAKNKLIEFIDSVTSGKIIPRPVANYGSKNLPCEYCDYWSVCGVNSQVEGKIIDENDKLAFTELIEKMAEDIQKESVGDENEVDW